MELFNNNNDESFLNNNDSPYYGANLDCIYSNSNTLKITVGCKDLLVLTINIQSITAKFNELEELLYNLSCSNVIPDVICLQELWQFPQNANFALRGYHPLVYKLRGNNTQGGGVGVYVKEGLSVTVLENYSIFLDRIYESIIVQILDGNQKYIVGSIYRPGSSPTLTQSEQTNNFFEIFANTLEQLNTKNTPVYLFGDFNLDILTFDSNPLVNDYINLLFSHGFLQIITKPTRCTSSSGTLIDHCITNATHREHLSRIITNKISDHFPILYKINKNESRKNPKIVQFRDFSDVNINNFKLYLSSLDWGSIYEIDDTQIVCNKIMENFNHAFELFFPLKIQRFNKNVHRKEPWFSKGLLVSRRNKNQLNIQASEFPSELNNQKFKKYASVYKKLVREAKKIYFRTQLQKNQANLKKTWALIRNATNLKPSKSSSRIVCINLGLTISSDPVEIANCFNTHFSTALDIIANSIHPPTPLNDDVTEQDFTANIPIFRLSDQPITNDELIEAVKSLESKTSQDIDCISMFLLKKKT